MVAYDRTKWLTTTEHELKNGAGSDSSAFSRRDGKAVLLEPLLLISALDISSEQLAFDLFEVLRRIV